MMTCAGEANLAITVTSSDRLTNGSSITVNNVNHGGTGLIWTDHTVPIRVPPAGLRGGDVKRVTLHTGFGGGIGGDNWNVQRIRLDATLK